MIKRFLFTWKSASKYDNIERHNIITIPYKDYEANQISYTASRAVTAFKQTFGNLKKNDIISIQEIDVAGMPVGEPITYDGE